MTDITRPYPRNLVYDVINMYTANKFDKKDIETTPCDLAGSVEYALAMLPDRGARFLHMRYRDNMTYEEIGQNENITRERARQLTNVALASLREPPAINYLVYGVQGVAQRKAQSYADELKSLRDTINSVFDIMDRVHQKPMYAEKTYGSSPTTDPHNTLITDFNLAVRTSYALKRAGITTLYDLLTTSPQTIIAIPNIGEKSYRDLIKAVEAMGWDMTRYRNIMNRLQP